MIPLKDGTTLAARIWLPDDAERNPVPAILEYLPYRKRDGTYERDALTHPYLAGNGYASVRVDIRGSGESSGLLFDEYSEQEQSDGLEVIAWLAAQPWCSGAVGMMGISWGGFNGLQIAARRPPALKAIVTLCSTDDRYRDDVHYMGGALLTARLGWASFFFTAMCHPPDPALVGDSWRSMWSQRIENVPLFLETWMRHQRRDAYWRRGSVCEDYDAIQCPVYAVGGWTDGYTNAIPRLLEGLSVPRKGLIGPWAHAYPHFALPGPQIGFLQEMLRWWDHWLKGIDTGVMDEPMLRAWMTESVKPASRHEALPGRWIAEMSWPPNELAPCRLFLTDDGLRPDGALRAARSICSAQTVGEHAGEWCPFGRSRDQADDQREDDARSLVFETTPLDAPIEILGAPVVTLDVVSDKSIANLVVRLCDVHPSGESLRVSYGVLNLTHRDGHETPAPLVPGRRYQVRVQLNDAGAVLPAGHKVRLALSTSLLADGLADPGEGHSDRLGRHARSAGAPAARHRCAAAAAGPGDGASGAVDGDPSRCRAHRPHRARTGSGAQIEVPHRGGRSAQRGRGAVAGGHDRAGRMADPDRDPDTAVLHQRCFPAPRRRYALKKARRTFFIASGIARFPGTSCER